MITGEQLKELLTYDAVTGVFIWNVSRGGMRAGDNAGKVGFNGYVYICVDRHLYLAHRLVWLYVYDVFPKQEIDHINRCRCDNRLINLRAASTSQNAWNAQHRQGQRTGVKGVELTRAGRYLVRFKANGKRVYLGVFPTLEEAVKVVSEHRAVHHGEFACH